MKRSLRRPDDRYVARDCDDDLSQLESGKRTMKHTSPTNTQRILRISSVFLFGVLTGVAGLALWAERAGVLVASPLLTVLLPMGLCIGIFVASLPALIGETLAALQRMNVANREAREVSNCIHSEPLGEPKSPA
jgi:hypothetical protein